MLNKTRYKFVPISQAAGYSELPKATRDSTQSADWVNKLENNCSQDIVYIWEAFGGADKQKIKEFAQSLSKSGRKVMISWTDDDPFAEIYDPNILIFDIASRSYFDCGYFFVSQFFNSSNVASWKKPADRNYIASFIGSSVTHDVRKSIFNSIVADQKDFLVKDADWWGLKSSVSDSDRWNLRVAYMDVCKNSIFVLCPRGNGISSIRRWEAMYLGAIPVLIDDYTNPFNLELPCVRIYSDGADELTLAKRINTEITGALRNAKDLQEQLYRSIFQDFDHPVISSHHTYCKQYLKFAEQYWG